jgi:hypothetical protein
MKREPPTSQASPTRPMTCEEVREQLADHMLGTLPDLQAVAVRRHLRGCGACRADAARLDQGISLFATAAHAAEPPVELKDRVMSALAEEWSEAPPQRPRRPVARWVALTAAALAFAGVLGWAGFSQVQASRSRNDAARYRSFLGALGGRNVRVAVLKPVSSTAIEGSAILYDSDRGQSWILVLARTPSYTGAVDVSVWVPGGPSIRLRPLQIDAAGDASTWLVTSSDISRFTHVTLRSPGGAVLASGVTVSED